jgi:GTP-binding protein
MNFVDLPGYGFARAPRPVREQWQPMVHGYLRGRSRLKAVVWLLDVRREPSKDDLQFLDFLEEAEIQTIPVVTKADKVSRNELVRRLDKISKATGLPVDVFVAFSVLNKQGIEEVWELIMQVLQEQ